MSNVSRWYCTRESLKSAVGIVGTQFDALIDSYIEAASEDIERLLVGRRFIPETATKEFLPKPKGAPLREDWAESENPWLYGGITRFIEISDLLAVTSITIDEDQDGSYADETELASTEYELLPRNTLPRTSVLLTPWGDQTSFPLGHKVQIVGRWGYSEDTKAAGALAEALDSSETGVDVTDASLIGVGDTLKVDSEAMFVSGRSPLTTTTTLNDTLTASESDVTVTVADGAKVKQGEVILLDSEKMLVEAITSNDLTVKRAYDGSVLAAHSNGATVYAYRTLTVVRGVNGTTAAAHDTAAAITKYAPPADIVDLCRAMAIGHLKQGESGWTGQISGGEAGVQVRMVDLFYLRQRAIEKYGRVTI